MIEYFATEYVMKMREEFLPALQRLFWFIFTLVISLLAAYIAYVCNNGENRMYRLFVVIFAFLFTGIYLLYFVIAHLLLRKKCSGKDIAIV